MCTSQLPLYQVYASRQTSHVGGYVIKNNNIRARDTNIFRNDGTHLSDIGINVHLNTIQGALESFLSSSGPRVFPLQYQNLDVSSLSISEVFVGVGGSFGGERV